MSLLVQYPGGKRLVNEARTISMTRAWPLKSGWFARRWLVAGVLSLAVGCTRKPDPAPEEREPVRLAQPDVATPPAPDPCELEIRRLWQEPALPGARDLQKQRAELLARARSVPVLFVQEPGESSYDYAELTDYEKKFAARMRRHLAEARDPTSAITGILRKTTRRFALRRAIFLSEGYLFADQPLLALRLSQVLRLDHLFDDDRLLIQRGAKLVPAVREEGKYWSVPPSAVDTTKPRSERAVAELEHLLLFDRVTREDEHGVAVFPEPLHLDFGPLQDELHFSHATVERITASGVVVTLHTGDVDSIVVVTGRDGEAILECESRGATSAQVLAKARGERARRKQLVDPILETAHEIIERRLPFDEPRTEEGQQDGKLRIEFAYAYQHYRETYEFNGDRYYVFDGYGRPKVPQVCIDFITDSFDWATGGDWPDRGDKRIYKKGAFRFKSFGLENARSVEQIAQFASENPEWFDMHWLADEDKVKFYRRGEFFAALAKDPLRYERGDVVFIYGLRDDERFHYHSFFVDERDPLTGVPTVVAANAGPPQARSWEGEMHNAPLRSIVARMRVRSEVLERAYQQARTQPGVPLEPPSRLSQGLDDQGD